jgi:uncharacterized protein YhfF
MNKSESVEKFWQNFCETAKINPETPYQVWCFGNTSEMARKLAELVLRGEKRATATLLESAKLHPESAPIADGYSIITDFEGNPTGIIQAIEIRHLPFDEVDADFAFEEGEGDKSLEYWREAHRRFFTEDAAENGVEFGEKSIVVCEKFKLLFPK